MDDPSDQELPAAMFARVDESSDALFYASPRMVTHIDDATIDALSAFYGEFIPQGSDVLDLMSSWVSHLPDAQYGHVAGLGMNEEELAANPRLTSHIVHDLNLEPALPYAEDTFDRLLIAVSIQYLTRPVEVMRSARQVLRAGGRVSIAMSHRLFPTKAIAAFTRLGPQERVRLVAYYLTTAGFVDVELIDRSPATGDPLWIVVGTAAASSEGQ